MARLAWIVPSLSLVVGCDARAPLRAARPAVSIVASPSATPAPPAPSASVVAPAVSAVAVEPPPYDLAADRAARIALAQRELGAAVPTAVAEEVFVVVGLPGTVTLIRRALAAFFNGRFAKRPSEAITIVLFDSAGPYDRYCRDHLGGPCISVYGFYRPDLRRIVMNAGPGLGTLTHELVHPILETDFPGAPTWINEGIASLYEGFAMPSPGEIRGVKNWRHPRVIAALASPKERELARLDRLFGMEDRVFRGPAESLNYAVARYVCQWLDERGWLWPFFQRWRDGRADDPTGEKAFRAVTGMAPDEAHALWVKWVRGL